MIFIYIASFILNILTCLSLYKQTKLRRSEILRISKQYADLMYEKEKSALLAQQCIKIQKKTNKDCSPG
ncbi:hypothetical protein CBF31_09200 [Vagococcus fessus]|uniref:Uncharacterized protein n=1 Tax=Vagococcus fessus TaxID=120370 RepID=A0A430A548_9ENTE|nr:hypothetical protein CBF31_09200 [Vagococcus fessus]